MTYTVQPPSGSALSPTWAAKGIVFARNEADTAVGDTVGAATRSVVGNGAVWGTGVGGRFKQAGAAGGSLEKWTGITIGPEYTIISVVRRVNNGGYQSPIDSDDSGNGVRNFLFRFDDSGSLAFIPFDASGATMLPGSPSALVSTTRPSVLIGRVRNSEGAYLAKAWVDGVGGSEAGTDSAGTTGGTVTTAESFAVATDRIAGSGRFSSESYETIIVNAALSDADIAAVSANHWVVWNDTGGTVTAPTISTQPTAQSVTAPATATFSVTATNGGGTLTYQWQRSNDGGTTWANVSTGTGGTSASYTTAATSTSDSGAKFRVTATNSNSGVTSNAVTLTVAAAAGTGGTITTSAVKNTGGSALASTTIPFVIIVPISGLPSLSNAVVKSNVATTSGGLLSVQDSGLTSGATYLVSLCDATGASYGATVCTAA